MKVILTIEVMLTLIRSLHLNSCVEELILASAQIGYHIKSF